MSDVPTMRIGHPLEMLNPQAPSRPQRRGGQVQHDDGHEDILYALVILIFRQSRKVQDLQWMGYQQS